MNNWDLDPKTGDYVMQGGAPKNTESLAIPAYFRLKISRNRWLYAPDTDYGSDFHLIKKRKTNGDASDIENIAARALQPLIDDGRAQSITIRAQQQVRHGVGIQVNIVDQEGDVQELEFVPLA